ncbi:unnamed protein product [Malassezia sympodialis ATCC 42132]|uniref:Uncharacterized protein n=1 Tax=Malassezia sympodialis (strain ATCC 42132) TaxID=1230383 RepID=M5ECS5_MALS4|nr:uncharacterized protein MSY001_3389 [Malassezia sympodialis ATCC 42132]CCV00683.1 unnamed protein product [Malassezia sympodialis ATCC 42132]SHO79910.1 Uncharacterized protein MSYG_4264 [Malassezia sympodialis ATCC 42132]|eukprot:XP_018741864.1 uncharacterized protein MSY001_3389 [Malassezia sympodialis ATCC 42132]
MDLSSVIRKGHPIAFAIFIVLSLILAIIASAVVANLNHHGNDVSNLIRDTTRFMVFTGWWSVLFGAIFLALFVTGIGGVLSSIASHGIFVLITWIFWLCGSAALSNAVGNAKCVSDENADGFIRDCDALKAIVAFGWIGWVELTLLLGVILFLGMKAFRGGRGVHDSLA